MERLKKYVLDMGRYDFKDDLINTKNNCRKEKLKSPLLLNQFPHTTHPLTPAAQPRTVILLWTSGTGVKRHSNTHLTVNI